MTSCYWL